MTATGPTTIDLAAIMDETGAILAQHGYSGVSYAADIEAWVHDPGEHQRVSVTVELWVSDPISRHFANVDALRAHLGGSEIPSAILVPETTEA